jgi:choline/glycine/proline betaine transport protein
MEGVVAAVLLLGGGLSILQTAAISSGLPFAIILLFIVYSLYLGLSQELYIENAVQDKLRDVEADHRLDEAIESVKEDLLDASMAVEKKES